MRTDYQVFVLPRPTHRLEFRVALIAALALIFAQLGAMAHAYSHVPETASLPRNRRNSEFMIFAKTA